MSLSPTSSSPPFYQDNGAPLSDYTAQVPNIGQGQLLMNNVTGDFYICSNNSSQTSLVWHNLVHAGQVQSLQAQADWSQATSSDPSFIKNKPSIPAAQINSDWNAVSGLGQILNKPSIPAAQIQSDWNQVNTSALDYIKNKPTLVGQVQSDWNQSNISAVDYIKNKPTIPSAQIQSDWAQTNSASLDFIKNKPTRTQSSATRTLNSAFQISSTRDCFVSYSVDIACTISLTTGQTGTVFLEIASDSGFTTNVQEIGRTVNGNSGTLTIGLNLTQNSTGTLSGYVPAGYYCRLRTANNVGTPTFNYRMGQEVLS